MVEGWRDDGEGWHNTHLLPEAEAHLHRLNDGDWWMDIDFGGFHLSGRAPDLFRAREFCDFCLREGWR